MSTPSEIFDEHHEELKRYLFHWGLSDKFDDMVAVRKTGTEAQLAMAAHLAWEALPDRPQIRTEPFFALSHMAEQIFGVERE